MAILQSEARPRVSAIVSRPILNAASGVLFGLTHSQFAALAVATIAPGVFTVASWAHSRAIRHYSLPLVIAEICLIGCCLGSGLPVVGALHHARRIALAAAVGLVSVGALATGLIASHPTPALLHLGITFVELTLGFCLWGAFISTWAGFQRRFLAAVAIGILCEVVLGYGLVLSARGDPDLDWVSFHAGTTHVRQIGFYGTALCGLSAGLLATAERPFKRLCYFALATIGFAWNDLSGGRAAFAAGFAGCGLVWALAPGSRKRVLGVELLASFGIAVPLSLIYIPSNFWGFWRILDGLTPHAGYATGRLSLWLTALKGIVASPWIGHGEDQLAIMHLTTLLGAAIRMHA